ncbi:hypothetical protein Leryth_014457 [Lithospermum erythrorhizon]|nr:hypothetical protein Leryth_014457 [Lithospermum erythrorhizon]
MGQRYMDPDTFFLTPDGTLRPLAIELVRPQGTVNGKQQEEWRHVFTPCWDATGTWLWRFAKAHVLAHDSGVHQLYAHTGMPVNTLCNRHIIATNRQLSAMHPPIDSYTLISCYTMEINAWGTSGTSINGRRIIETTFLLA